MSDTWGIAKIWNDTMETREERPAKARSNMWASELGSAYIDRYLKMSGVEASNKPNARSLRKFEAGNFMEWVIGMVLRRAGIMVSAQEWVSFTYPGLLEVTGKIDYIGGGKPEWSAATKEIEALELPEFFGKAAQAMVENLAAQHPDGLAEMPIEVKSCSSFMFDLFDTKGKPEPRHALQLFHYLKAKNYPKGIVLYVCKDDLRLLEFPVLNPGPVEALYRDDIAKMTEYWHSQEQPPLEPLMDLKTGKFNRNFNVEYSNYLTMLYGYETPEAYREAIGDQVKRFNYAYNRYLKGDKLTDKNLEVIEEIRAAFPDLELKLETINAKKGTITRQAGTHNEEEVRAERLQETQP